MKRNKKYKVEIKESIVYAVDVLASNEEEAKKEARKKWKEYCNNGTYHYHEVGNDTDFGNIYDVTNTDDPFNPEN
jgi:DNA polymerase IIIc chi subunit